MESIVVNMKKVVDLEPTAGRLDMRREKTVSFVDTFTPVRPIWDKSAGRQQGHEKKKKHNFKQTLTQAEE